jgi:hypothetical protein
MPVFRIKAEKPEMRLARSDPRIQKDRRDVAFPLQLAFNGTNPEVRMQGLEVSDQDDGVAVSLQRRQHRAATCA